MVNCKKYIDSAADLARDIQALDQLASGITQDSFENKEAVATLLRVLASKAASLNRQLTAEAEKLAPLLEKIRVASEGMR